MRALIAEPARRRAAEERARVGEIQAAQPAHLLAFGEAFDPVIPNPGFYMDQPSAGMPGMPGVIAAKRQANILSRTLEIKQ